MNYRRLFGFALIAGVMIGVGPGCELIASVDRSKIVDGVGNVGGEGAGGLGGSVNIGGAGGSGGAAGMGGSGGAAGMGGSGGVGGFGGPTCSLPEDCPGSANECLMVTCINGLCGAMPKLQGTVINSQTQGDCQVLQCDGAGGPQSITDNLDLPDDGLDCTDDQCMNGAPMFVPMMIGTACGANGALVCDGAGQCVGCNSPSDCGGVDNACQSRTCNGNVCGMSFEAAGTVTGTQTSGDCKQNQCDGAGNIVTVNADADIPVDGNECTDDLCTSGVPSNPASALNTGCAQNGGTVCNGVGACVAAPEVIATSPSDGAMVLATIPISVTFSSAMNPATLVAQTNSGACAGSIQVSKDNFASCIAFAAAAPTMSNGNATATLQPAPGLLVNRTYKIRVTMAAASITGIFLQSVFTHPVGFGTQSPSLCEGSVVISQIFGGGGSSAGVPNADYVELHNRGSSTISLAGWSVQYAAATGTGWSANTAPLSGSIDPGGYFLVRMQAPQGTGVALPTPDVSGTNFNLSATAGKVALVSSTTALVGNCPSSANIVDFVGYGATADCNEGGANAPAPANNLAEFRVQTACADVNRNQSDFATSAPAPRNKASAPSPCACMVRNESGALDEADYCNTQFPLSLVLAPGAASGDIFGQIFETGITEGAGANVNVRAQLGFGPPNANPQYESAWKWSNGVYNIQTGNNDEYKGSFIAPLTLGSYRYAFRFSRDNGMSWTVCDSNAAPDLGAGSNAGLFFEFEEMATLTVQ